MLITINGSPYYVRGMAVCCGFVFAVALLALCMRL